MKVLIYVNKLKKESESFLKSFSKILANEKIDYALIEKKDLERRVIADAVFVYGGDGTILGLSEFSINNNLPIIGFNAGKVGFLTEFEQNEAKNTVKLFKAGKLKRDERLVLSVKFNDKTYYALNDAVVQRQYSDNSDGLIISVSAYFDDIFVDKISGDGVIVSTPTGSTAYSLSAGGSILSPGINACIMTPLAAQSLHNRPIVFSADSTCSIKLESAKAGLFIDGKKIADLKSGNKVDIKKSENQIVFLRKEDSDFYLKLEEKLYN